MEISMSVVKYSGIRKFIGTNTLPFAICLSKNDNYSSDVNEFIEKHYGITVDKRGYGCCICNIILADKCREYKDASIKFRDKSVKKIKEYIPIKSTTLYDKVVVKFVFEDNSKLDSIELVNTIIEDIENGKIFINE